MHTAFIALGSNMGDKLRHCRQGILALERHDAVRILTVSPFYRTEPVDYTDQDWFLNAVIQISTLLDPVMLLKVLKTIEREVGRVPDGIRFGPRILDMDILLFDRLILNTDQLIIPHPRMHKRRFVLQPICDIAPEVLHPLREQTMRQLLTQLPSDEQRIEPFTCDC